MKTLCAIVLPAAVSGPVHSTATSTILMTTTTLLFLASLGFIALISLRHQPQLRRVRAVKK